MDKEFIGKNIVVTGAACGLGRAVAMGLAGQSVFEALANRSRADQILLDLVNLPNRAAIRATVEGLCW